MMAITAIIILLVTAAKVTAKVTSPAESGAYKISTIFPWILPIINEEDECEKDFWITCIAIKPGARKLIKGTPNTSPLPLPIAKDKTNKKSKKN